MGLVHEGDLCLFLKKPDLLCWRTVRHISVAFLVGQYITVGPSNLHFLPVLVITEHRSFAILGDLEATDRYRFGLKSNAIPGNRCTAMLRKARISEKLNGLFLT